MIITCTYQTLTHMNTCTNQTLTNIKTCSYQTLTHMNTCINQTLTNTNTCTYIKRSLIVILVQCTLPIKRSQIVWYVGGGGGWLLDFNMAPHGPPAPKVSATRGNLLEKSLPYLHLAGTEPLCLSWYRHSWKHKGTVLI